MKYFLILPLLLLINCSPKIPEGFVIKVNHYQIDEVDFGDKLPVLEGKKMKFVYAEVSIYQNKKFLAYLKITAPIKNERLTHIAFRDKSDMIIYPRVYNKESENCLEYKDIDVPVIECFEDELTNKEIFLKSVEIWTKYKYKIQDNPIYIF